MNKVSGADVRVRIRRIVVRVEVEHTIVVVGVVVATNPQHTHVGVGVHKTKNRPRYASNPLYSRCCYTHVAMPQTPRKNPLGAAAPRPPSGYIQESGADVRARIRRTVVRVEVEHTIVVVGVVAATNPQHTHAGVGVHIVRYIG